MRRIGIAPGSLVAAVLLAVLALTGVLGQAPAGFDLTLVDIDGTR
jgi:hypothetical protein